jgi:hypothetical protein
VAILAGIGLSQMRRRRLRYALLIGAGAECIAGPLPLKLTPPPIPPVYARLAELSEPGALLVLPLPHPDRFQDNALYVYRSIFHWRPLVNGYSGFVPESYREAHRLLGQEDFARSLSTFEAKGVRWVLAHTGRLGPRLTRKLQEAEDSGRLTLLFDENGDRLYRIP